MKPEMMKKYLLEKKEIIASLDVKPRLLAVEKTKNFITIFIGPRRAGKTYCMYDLIKNKEGLDEGEYLFMNMEDVDLAGIGPLAVKDAINVHEQLYGRKPGYLFLDEIQALRGWEKLVNSLYETKQFCIFISGSSSKLLSREIASLLRGRSLSYVVLPFSFSEFVLFHGIGVDTERLSPSKENQVKHLLDSYARLGGFPDVVITPAVAERFYKDYLDLVVFKDIVERHGIKNIPLVRFLINASLSSFGKVLSVHKLFNTAKSKGIEASKKSLYTYMSYLEESFFTFLLKKYSPSAKEIESSLPKLYLGDVGLKNVVLSSSPELGCVCENLVFLELKRLQNSRPLLKFYYYKVMPQGYEVDFVVMEGPKVRQLIQVAYNLEESREREVRALLHASRELGCRDLVVITNDYEGTEQVRWFGMARKVTFISLWKWLLERSDSKPRTK